MSNKFKVFLLIIVILIGQGCERNPYEATGPDLQLMLEYNNMLVDDGTQLREENWKLKAEKTLSIVEVIPKIKPGVVHINCPQWQGSGFVVAPNLIMTARHCVEDIENFEITTDDGHKLKAVRAISSKKYDIAFIYIDDLTCVAEKCEHEFIRVLLLGEHKVELRVLELGSITECQLGQELITIGSPYGKINFNSITLGIISGLDRDYDPLNDSGWGHYDYGWSVAFQTDSPGHPGNSGCAVFTADGIVRGILVGGFSPSLIIAMPVDIFLEEIETVKLMFIQDKYYREKIPDNRFENMYDWYEQNKDDNRLDELWEWFNKLKETNKQLYIFIQLLLISSVEN